jgi:Protein of unknown function (DUF4235)
MSKVLFTPVSILSGLLGGLIGKKIFEQLWGLVDKEEPPDAKHRDVPWGKVIVALLVEGAIFRAVRGLIDRGTRIGYERLTGTWPGEARPEPE